MTTTHESGRSRLTLTRRWGISSRWSFDASPVGTASASPPRRRCEVRIDGRRCAERSRPDRRPPDPLGDERVRTPRSHRVLTQYDETFRELAK